MLGAAYMNCDDLHHHHHCRCRQIAKVYEYVCVFSAYVSVCACVVSASVRLVCTSSQTSSPHISKPASTSDTLVPYRLAGEQNDDTSACI